MTFLNNNNHRKLVNKDKKKKKNDKKSYLYIPNVLKDDKLFYFKYPRLGSFSCFPLKINSYLSVGTL